MRPTLAASSCLLFIAFLLTMPPPVSTAQKVFAEGSATVDHIILGVSDLEEGIEQLEALTGVRAVIGGEHPGRGTWNALIALGPRHYLEVLAPVPGGEIDDLDVLAADLKDFAELTPVGWAVSPGDMDGLVEKLVAKGYEIEGPAPGSRVKPDGSVLEWRSLAIQSPLLAGVPFFIEWSESSVHPSESSPQGCELDYLRLEGPDGDALRDLASLLGLEIRVVGGASLSLEFGLDCPRGAVRFSSK